MKNEIEITLDGNGMTGWICASYELSENSGRAKLALIDAIPSGWKDCDYELAHLPFSQRTQDYADSMHKGYWCARHTA